MLTGTYINGNKIGPGTRVTIKNGDRISLVLSVAPLVEQFFIYHEGDPMNVRPSPPAHPAPNALPMRLAVARPSL